MSHAPSIALALTLLTAACGDPGDLDSNANEVITTVALTFTPDGGGADTTFEFDDPDGDGGEPPSIDDINLAPGTYTMTVRFENRLETPPEDITEEVSDEAEEHQLFITGSAVDGPATDNSGAPLLHTYADQDAGGLPIGLSSSIVAVAGSGELTVTLRHLPPLNDVPTKVADLAATVRDDGFAALGGGTDAQVSFDVTVQ